jgi:hypothetical protein
MFDSRLCDLHRNDLKRSSGSSDRWKESSQSQITGLIHLSLSESVASLFDDSYLTRTCAFDSILPAVKLSMKKIA